MPKTITKKRTFSRRDRFRRPLFRRPDRDFTIEDFDLNDLEKKDWSTLLRDRKKLVKRGSATAIGIRIVKDQLRTVNSNLKKNLLSNTLPLGFGTPSKPLNRESEMLDCLFEVRELLVTLGFHLDVKSYTQLPSYVPVTPDLDVDFGTTAKKLLTTTGKPAGTITLEGLVNRYSSAIFSDHHGLVLKAKIDGKPDLSIYYQSLDATHNFIGGTSVRTSGSIFTKTDGLDSEFSLRGATGFAQQFARLIQVKPEIDVIILAEVGKKDGQKLMHGFLNQNWSMLTNNDGKDSGVNDITVFYKTQATNFFSISIESLKIGNSAVIWSNKGSDSECILVGSHILNSMAKIKSIDEFMTQNKCAAIFGDTNLDSNSTNSKIFEIVTTNNSITDSFSLLTSNSANTTMFDKLLVRKK